MCGIIGITSRSNIVPMLIEGLKRLEYRGYDSAGFGLIDCRAKKIVVLKDRGRIDNVVRSYNVADYCSFTGIAHTRWATHGRPTKINAHPHTDCEKRIAVVHNGIIKNYLELKKDLIKKGHRFVSETDTEVIPHFLEEYINNGYTLLDALRELIRKLEGAYAIVIISENTPNKIFFARRLSPLVIGVGSGYNIVSSDIPSFLKYTRNVIVINDYEIGYISPTEIYIEKEGEPLDYTRRLQRITWSLEDAEKGGYPHFMLKEVFEQPRALHETFAGLQSDDAIAKVVDLLSKQDKILVTGAGTSFHAALTFQLYWFRIAKRPIISFISSEHNSYEPLADRDTLLIAISQSGETIDTLQAIRAFKSRGAKIVAVSNVVASSIPREADVAIYTRAGPEIGVAATKTFLTQVLTLQYVTLAYAETQYGYDAKGELKYLSRAGELVRETLVKTKRAIEKTAWEIKNQGNILVLSRDLGVPLALEAALKIKEISYIHAEAYPAGESKHGPIALIEKGFPVIFVMPSLSAEILSRIEGNIMEMKARGALTIFVGAKTRESISTTSDIFIEVPEIHHHLLLPYATMPPLQLLAYRLAVLRGYDPDKPRNLAKTVTVE